MNSKIISLLIVVLVFAIGSIVIKNKNSLKVETNENTEVNTEVNTEEITGSNEYTANIEKSSTEWQGKKPLINDYTDIGTISLKEGNLVTENGLPVKGFFVFDMNSINTSSTGVKSGESMLTKHLKSPDFFDTERFPEARLEIKSVTKNESDYTATADLEIKNIRNEISFPVQIETEGQGLKITGITSLDRSKWDIRFASKSFFENLGDKLIDDMFTVKFEIIVE